jgi:hypothetical protein
MCLTEKLKDFQEEDQGILKKIYTPEQFFSSIDFILLCELL